MIVDIHVHFPRKPEIIKKIVEAAEDVGIDRLCLLAAGLKSEWSMYGFAPEEVMRIMEQYPEVIGFHPGSCVDPQGVADLERSVKELGLRGMKILPGEALVACHALYRKAGELKIPVVAHPSTPIVDAEIARLCPETTFIFAHVGFQWEEAFQAAKPYDNACFDTAGGDCFAGVVERGVELLGPERIFFGSDVPVRNFAAQMTKVQYADISKKDKRLILGDNAARILELR